LKVPVKWNWWWNFTCVLPDNSSELWNLLTRVPMRKCFWYYCRQLFISLAFRKCTVTMSSNKPLVCFFSFFFFCFLVSLVHLVFCINYWNITFLATCVRIYIYNNNILILGNMALHDITYKKHQVPTEEYCYFIKFQVYFKIKLQI